MAPVLAAVGTDGRVHTTAAAIALLHQAQAGNLDAFAALYEGYRDLIGRYTCARTGDRDAAEDLIHDTFTDALVDLPQADDDVVGWLLRLASRACTRHLRSQRRHRRAAHELYEQPRPPKTDPQPQHIALVAAMLAHAPLTDSQRQAVQLRLAGYPRERAATAMARTPEAVRCLERRAIATLRTTTAGPR